MFMSPVSLFLPPLFPLLQLAKKQPQVGLVEASYSLRGRAVHQGHFLQGNKAEEEDPCNQVKATFPTLFTEHTC